MNQAIKVLSGCALVVLLACGGLFGLAILNSWNKPPASVNLPPPVASPVVPSASPPALPAKGSPAPSLSTKANVTPAAPVRVRWEDQIAKQRQDVDLTLRDFSSAQRALLASIRSGQEPGVIADTPKVGDFGRLGALKFLTIVGKDAAQFTHAEGDGVFFIKGVDLDGLVPNKVISYPGVWEVVDTIEYKTLLGARRRGPVLVAVREGAIRQALAEQKRVDDLDAACMPWRTFDNKTVVGMFRRIDVGPDGFAERLIVEEYVDEPIEIPVEQLLDDDLEFARKLHGSPVRVAEPLARPLLLDGHKFRPRTWSTADGKFSVEASFLSITGGDVKLKRIDNGKEISIDPEKLCDADRAYLKAKGWKLEPLER